MAQFSTKLAKRYAKALFDALPESDYESVDSALKLLADDVAEHEELQNVLLSPTISVDQKLALLSEITSLFLQNSALENFVKILVQNGRGRYLPDCAEAFSALFREFKNSRRVEVASAFTLPEDERQAVLGKLREEFGEYAEVAFITEPDLLGGLRIRCGDHVLDTSVRGRLGRAREQLVGEN